jgi:hypothetical protein
MCQVSMLRGPLAHMRIVPLLVGALLVYWAWNNFGPYREERWQQQGREEAESDLAAGKLCLKGYGFPAPEAWTYYKLARKRLGITCEHGGCCVTDELLARAKGYNERMKQEIGRRFGPDAMDRLEKEADEAYKKEQEAKRKPTD